MSRKLFVLSIIFVFLMTGCIKKNNNNTSLPNPASVYCEDNGGKLEIRTSADGSQSGVCVFPDGSECDEWAFMRGECRPGDVTPNTVNPVNPNDAADSNPAILPANAIDSVYCEELGGSFEVRPVDDDGWTGNCILPEKNNCSALAFSRGECEIGGPYTEDQLN